MAERPWATTRALWGCVAAIILSATLMSAAAAASSQEVTTPPKLHELLTLLADPKIQEWLEAQGEAKAAAGSVPQADPSAEEGFGKRWGSMQPGEHEGDGGSLIRGLPAPVFHESKLSSGADAIHDQIVALARAIPGLPNEFARAAGRITAVHGEYGGPEPSSTLRRSSPLASSRNGCSGG
jgi:hypothetical protein